MMHPNVKQKVLGCMKAGWQSVKETRNIVSLEFCM